MCPIYLPGVKITLNSGANIPNFQMEQKSILPEILVMTYSGLTVVLTKEKQWKNYERDTEILS
jgi:hypothetical protein